MDTLHSIVKQKHLLKHPFYRLWLKGKLPKEALQNYAGQYFQLVSNLPRFISSLHANCEDETTRQQLVHHLMEEELGFGNGNVAHTELWLDFAEGLGVKRDKIDAEALPETRKALSELKKICANDFLAGTAALLAYEAQISDIAELKMKGLIKHYHIKDKKALKFFRVHKKVDIEHQKTWKKMIGKHAKTSLQKAQVREALNKSLKAMHLLLDGVYKKYC